MWSDPERNAATSSASHPTSGLAIHNKRVQLILRGDNVGALSLSFKLRLTLLKMAVIARLAIAHMAFLPLQNTPLVLYTRWPIA